MYLEQLELENVRVVRSANLSLCAQFNVLIGPNGSGKTSCLEAVYLLSTGRSFRNARAQARHVIQHTQSFMRAVGVVVHDGGERRRLGVERRASTFRARVDGQEVRQAARLARELLVVVVEPDCQRLLTDGADLRRRLLDWIMFHVEQEYGALYSRYRRALKQRNALLRSESRDSAVAWDNEVIETGQAVAAARQGHVPTVLVRLGEILSSLVEQPISLIFDDGFDVELGLTASLKAATRRDQSLGYTTVGPHRCDLRLETVSGPVQNALSRGESKLAAASLVVAQALYVHENTGRRPIVLVDDLASELDVHSRARLFLALADAGFQVLLTTVTESLAMEAPSGSTKSFHVEHGYVSEVLE